MLCYAMGSARFSLRVTEYCDGSDDVDDGGMVVVVSAGLLNEKMRGGVLCPLGVSRKAGLPSVFLKKS